MMLLLNKPNPDFWPSLLRLGALVGLATAIGVGGALLLAPGPGALPPAIIAAGPPAVDTAPAANLFGRNEALATQVIVAGSISDNLGGAAVLRIDGGPATAWRVGQEVAPGLVLTRVDETGIELEREGGRLQIAVQPSAPVVKGIQSLPASQTP